MKRLSPLAFPAFVLVVILGLFLTGFQNAGNTGTATTAQQVTYTAGVSQIFRNVGQSAHFLTYCTAGFSGSIDLEASFDGATNWTQIAFANYIGPDGACHVLQAGGYYQNIRSVAAVLAGSITATYQATSGPISFAPAATGQTGPTSPIVCNTIFNTAVANAATAALVAGISNLSVHVCDYQISFVGAPAAGTMAFNQSAACAAPATVWGPIQTTATTPQQIIMGSGIGSLFRVPISSSLCFTNNSGTGVEVSVSVAQFPDANP